MKKKSIMLMDNALIHKCRFCASELYDIFLDLGYSPLANNYTENRFLYTREDFYPLKVFVCRNCYLVQIPAIVSRETLFNEYLYFSSFSKTWLNHAEKYVNHITNRMKLSSLSLVVEIASNDGYLLQYFMRNGIPVLGIEPAKNVAEVAIKKGIPTEIEFFGKNLAERLVTQNRKADLIIGNNVLAHVPDLHDFIAGLKILLKKNGVITLEFPHLMRLIDGNQFDTIYHEHFSYFSFITVKNIFAKHGLNIFCVDELSTHGGSLRIYVKHMENDEIEIENSVYELESREKKCGYTKMDFYLRFNEKIKSIKREILKLFISIKNEGGKIVGYGAPAKATTLLNYCGIRADFIDYIVDKSPYKQGRYVPGTFIPIHSPEKIRETKPDYIIIFPWNIKEEIIAETSFIREWGGKFLVLIPQVQLI